MGEISNNERYDELSDAEGKLSYCLTQLQKYKFKKGVKWDMDIVSHLTIEEVIWALIAAEQKIRNLKLELEEYYEED